MCPWAVTSAARGSTNTPDPTATAVPRTSAASGGDGTAELMQAAGEPEEICQQRSTPDDGEGS
jgi:hypothetical protein